MNIDREKVFEIIELAVWIMIGVLVMIPDGGTVSKGNYFLCWLVLILTLILNFFEKRGEAE